MPTGTEALIYIRMSPGAPYTPVHSLTVACATAGESRKGPVAYQAKPRTTLNSLAG